MLTPRLTIYIYIYHSLSLHTPSTNANTFWRDSSVWIHKLSCFILAARDQVLLVREKTAATTRGVVSRQYNAEINKKTGPAEMRLPVMTIPHSSLHTSCPEATQFLNYSTAKYLKTVYEGKDIMRKRFLIRANSMVYGNRGSMQHSQEHLNNP